MNSVHLWEIYSVDNSYQTAKKHGYSDEEIADYLGKKDSRYQKALDAGYSAEEILSYISKQSQPKESLAGNIGRQAARTGARVAETVLGAPRALGEFGEMLIPEERVKTLAGKVGLRKPVEKGFEFAKKYAAYKLFPKSEDIRENITKNLFGEKLEPKNEWEKKADTLVSDFAALAVPVPGSQLKLLKPALLAAGATAASEGVGYIGGTEKQKAYTKLGTIVIGSLVNPKSAVNLEKDLYNQAKASRPIDATVDAKALIKNADSFEKQLLKGDPGASSKKKSLDLIKDIKTKVKKGNIEVEELEQFKRDINEARSGLYETFKSDKVGRKASKRNLDMVSNLIDKSLTQYGKTNPEWEAFYRPANEVHGAIAQSKRARNWIGKNAKRLGSAHLLVDLGLYHYGGGSAVGKAALATGVGAAGLLGAEMTARIFKSPTLRKHYMNVINSALKEDIVATHENLKKLDSELKKEKS